MPKIAPVDRVRGREVGGIVAILGRIVGPFLGSEKGMLYRLGRLLQIVGMAILPVAVVGNLVPDHPLDLRQSLTFSGVGIVIFIIGYLLQQAGRPS
jgi:drug/metabolite transporter (DMT)-like permease